MPLFHISNLNICALTTVYVKDLGILVGQPKSMLTFLFLFFAFKFSLVLIDSLINSKAWILALPTALKN
ncbi:unnamed protein product [Meloidogyne enterolobii]|uniref:Uncharacterized protein n=1 Tax=Meloidogyne enterolobii TaxID=390850 RepID=A0ACB0ZG24_MELEN